MPGRKTEAERLQESSKVESPNKSGSDGLTACCEVDSAVSRTRIRFLAMALINTILPALVGIMVYHVTHSLTIEVDFASAACDALSLFLNIVVEYLKHGTASGKMVLLLDFGGGFVSMALLFGVAVFGVLNATNRAFNPIRGDEHVDYDHVGLMVLYNCFSLLLDCCTLVFWWRSRDLLMPPGNDQQSDQLNVNSGLLHSIVDFMRGLSVTGTSFWMVYINLKRETPWMELKEKVHVDVFGSFLLCACVIVSAAFLLKESIETLRKICIEQDCAFCVRSAKKVEDQVLNGGKEYVNGTYGSLRANV